MANQYFAGASREQVVPMQRVDRITIPKSIARLAWNEYVKRFPGQEFDDFFERRGGFSSTELIYLLADALERELNDGG